MQLGDDERDVFAEVCSEEAGRRFKGRLSIRTVYTLDIPSIIKWLCPRAGDTSHENKTGKTEIRKIFPTEKTSDNSDR